MSEALTEGDEIDSDLASIESEVGRTEAIQFARQRPSPEPLSVIHRIAEDLPTNIPQVGVRELKLYGTKHCLAN